MLKNRPDRRTILETQELFKLPSPALVEKDWFVVQALAAIHDVNVEGLTLAFGGGTALGRAYGLIKRMSEDIDLRIIGENAGKRGPLKRLRAEVSARLEAAGFEVTGHVEVKHNDTYVRYDLPYPSSMGGEGVLRPEIKIELSAFPICTAPETRSVTSFIAEATQGQPEAPAVSCVRLVETAADKFVALGRRAGSAFIGHDEALDHTLARHVYDLARMEGHYDLDEAVAIAIKSMPEEAARRADKYDAYRQDPKAETLRVFDTMATHADFIASYEALMRDLVYGDKTTFAEDFPAVQSFAERVRGAN